MSPGPGFALPRVVSDTSTGGGAAAALAIQVGHALGLAHDGTANSVYFAGQDKWAPIMVSVGPGKVWHRFH